jgi:hypothetical protein
MKASRWAVLAIAGAGAAGSAYVLESDRGAVAQPSPAASAPAQPTPARSAFADLERASISSRMSANPFGSPAVRREPPRAPVVVAPPPPPPPAFPYKYAGTVKHANGASEAFLMRGGELLSIKPGELLEGQWRIEALTAARIEVTYVPAGERRSLLLADLVTDPAPSTPSSAQTNSVATYEQPAAGRSIAQSGAAPSLPGSFAGGIAGGRAGVAAAAPSGLGAPAAPRVVADASAPSASAVAAPAASGASSTPLGAPTPTTSARLGSDAPTQGSMPLGAAPSGSFPRGPTPTGKLGL